MTEQIKQRIAALRESGLSYAAISQDTGMAVASIKSYCQRNALGGVRSAVGRGALAPADACEQCGKPVRQQKGRKHKRFCCDACRMQWWSGHREQMQRKSFHRFICIECAQRFERYGVKERRFCSRECYAAHRFHSEVAV